MRKSFSLVEILVVVTIITLLASIAAVSYSRFVKQSKDARRKSDIEQIRAAIELYRNFKGSYPSPATAQGMAFGSSSIDDAAAIPTISYMSKIPADPMPTTYTYYYTSPGGYQDYTLCAYVEGGDTTTISANCGSVCNYCMGPYGQK